MHGVWVVNSANIFICVEWKRPVNVVYKSWMLWLLCMSPWLLWMLCMVYSSCDIEEYMSGTTARRVSSSVNWSCVSDHQGPWKLRRLLHCWCCLRWRLNCWSWELRLNLLLHVLLWFLCCVFDELVTDSWELEKKCMLHLSFLKRFSSLWTAAK